MLATNTETCVEPLVTIILTAYNQEKYIGETLQSIAGQSYRNIQLIIVDNASTDGTVGEIEKYKKALNPFLTISHTENLGLCKAFNRALAVANGKYIIDLSGDDLLLPERVSRQVEQLEMLGDSYGVVFSNARHIDETGGFIGYHYPIDANGKALRPIPCGDVYGQILERYFICTPTMMMRRSVLEELNGYDESLVFEDFDFWVRSSVMCKYFYQDEILTSKRRTPMSLSTLVFKKNSGMLESCYTVCCKALKLNRNQNEFDLLASRIRTFIRKCWYAEEFELGFRFSTLLRKIDKPGWKTEMILFLCQIRVPVNRIYRFYIRNFHN